MDFYAWLKENIDPNVVSAKHRTKAGQAIGTAYMITLPCNKRRNGKMLVIEFWNDKMFLVLNEAWIDEETARRVLLAAKEPRPAAGTEKEGA